MEYDEGKPVPTGYQLRSEIRTGIVIAGGVVFWGTYIPAVAIAWVGVRRECELQQKPGYCEGGRGYYPLNIPFAGPFIAIHTLDADAAEGVGLVALGTLQTVGVGLVITGLAAPKKVLVRDAGVRDVTVAPRIGKDSLGIGVTGAM
jgi:hypothetical protein